jgi:hypothetical protein
MLTCADVCEGATPETSCSQEHSPRFGPEGHDSEIEELQGEVGRLLHLGGILLGTLTYADVC